MIIGARRRFLKAGLGVCYGLVWVFVFRLQGIWRRTSGANGFFLRAPPPFFFSILVARQEMIGFVGNVALLFETMIAIIDYCSKL